jgi:hypothetical protein
MWPNWNATSKDILLKGMFKEMVELRLAREMNVTPDLYVPIHYMSNPNCINSLRNALCWYNFPKCDDQNRSLPLCESTCNEYYSNCKYKTADDGSFTFCGRSAVKAKGLFDSGVAPGPDQVLAEDRPQNTGWCKRVPMDEEIGITVEQEPTPWYKAWWGISLMAIGGMLLLGFLFYALIPRVLRDYLKKTFWRFLRMPYSIWSNLPTMAGKMVFSGLAVVFVAAFAVGAYRIMASGMDRLKQEKAADSQMQFVPPRYIWGTQATKPLTNTQLRQLKNSCTCTGSANRGLPAALTCAFVLVYSCVSSIAGP